MLARTAGQDDFAIGVAVANRTRPEIEGLIGFFVNALALRADLSGEPGFDTVVERVRQSALGAFAHQDLPFEKLVAELAPVRDVSRTPLFQAMLTLQSAAESQAGQRSGFAGLTAEWLEVPGATAKFDLTLLLERDAAGVLPDRYIELRYEDLDARPMDAVAAVYSALNLPGFEAARGKFEAYLASVRSFEKNKFACSQEAAAKVENRLGRFVRKWRYERPGVAAE